VQRSHRVFSDQPVIMLAAMGNNLAVKQGLPRWPSARYHQETGISKPLRNPFQGLK